MLFICNHVVHSLNQVKHIFATYVLYVVSFLVNVFSSILKSPYFQCCFMSNACNSIFMSHIYAEYFSGIFLLANFV